MRCRKQGGFLLYATLAVVVMFFYVDVHGAQFEFTHSQRGSSCYFSDYTASGDSSVSMTPGVNIDTFYISAQGAKCRPGEVTSGARIVSTVATEALGKNVCTSYVSHRSCLAQHISWWVRWGAEYEYTTKSSSGPNDAPQCLAYGECYRDLCGSVGGEISSGEDISERISYSACSYISRNELVLQIQPYCCPANK